MEKETFKKLTEEEKQKVISVINELLFEELPNDPAEDDVFYNQKIEEFTGAITFGEIAYQLVNQTLVYISVN